MRTIFLIPMMFTEGELAEINPELPTDYMEKAAEFWTYVAEKLKTQRAVHKLYFDSLTKEKMEDALEFVRKSNAPSYNILIEFKETGAELMPTEDYILLEETVSWVKMLEEGKNSSKLTQEFLAQTMVDREKFIAKTVNESLKDGETGILFLKPGRRTGDYFPSDIRVIKIQPFDPSDYLNSWLVTLKLRSKESGTSNEVTRA